MYTAQEEKYNTNVRVVSHPHTSVSTPTGPRGQQITEISQLEAACHHTAKPPLLSVRNTWRDCGAGVTHWLPQTNLMRKTWRKQQENKSNHNQTVTFLCICLLFMTGSNMPTSFPWKRFSKVKHTSTLSCSCEYSRVWVCMICEYVSLCLPTHTHTLCHVPFIWLCQITLSNTCENTQVNTLLCLLTNTGLKLALTPAVCQPQPHPLKYQS